MFNLQPEVFPVQLRDNPHEDPQWRQAIQVSAEVYKAVLINPFIIFFSLQMPVVQEGFQRLEHSDEASPDPLRREALPVQTLLSPLFSSNATRQYCRQQMRYIDRLLDS